MSRPSLAMFRASPRHPRRGLAWAAAAVVLAAVVLYCVLAPPWVIEPLGKGGAGGQSFSPDRYVASIWSGKLLPAVRRSAVSFPVLLSGLKHHPAATEHRYGHYAVEGGPPAFLAKGRGKVVSLQASSDVALAGVALGRDSGPDLFLQVGKSLSGTDVRDALPFISFGQFANQVQYGEVAIAINSKISSSYLAALNPRRLKGKTIVFTGAFTFAGAGKPQVTPITLAVGR